jgi:hypothetical protein
MFRVLSYHLLNCFEEGGAANCDVAEVLGGELPCLWDTAPRDAIFEILTDGLGYDANNVYTAKAGALYPVNPLPQSLTPTEPFDSSLEDHAEKLERTAANEAWAQRLFSYERGECQRWLRSIYDSDNDSDGDSVSDGESDSDFPES